MHSTNREIKTMSKSDQYGIAAVIYAAIALLFICAFGGSVYGLLETKQAAFVPMAALFGIFGFSALFASGYAYKQAAI
mgnify:CR=1 FL=1